MTHKARGHHPTAPLPHPEAQPSLTWSHQAFQEAGMSPLLQVSGTVL